MKKVLFTATVDSHIEHFHLPYLKLFKENGYEVHVATNTSNPLPYCDVKHCVSFERQPLRVNNLRAIKQIKKITQDNFFDIIHTHTPMGSVVTRIGSKEARRRKTKILYTAHGLHFFKGAGLINWCLYYPIEWLLAKYTNILILINSEDYKNSKKFFSNRVPYIKQIPGIGLDESKFNNPLSDAQKVALRESLGLKQDDFVAIYPAELSKRKRQIWLIKTLTPLLKKYPNFKILLPGIDSLNGSCQELVERLGLEKQIYFLGYRRDVPNLLSISDMSLSAASQEGLPVNLLEAMYLGLPIVASDCRGNRDLVFDGVNGFLIPQNDSLTYLERVETIYLSKGFSFGNESQKLVQKYLLKNVLIELKKIYKI